MLKTILECFITFFAVYGLYELIIHFLNLKKSRQQEYHVVVPISDEGFLVEQCVRSLEFKFEIEKIILVFYDYFPDIMSEAIMLQREFDNIIIFTYSEYIEFMNKG